MTEYHVELPHGMVLTVEIEDTPIKMHITLPSGNTRTFHYVGNLPGPQHRRATVTPLFTRLPIPIVPDKADCVTATDRARLGRKLKKEIDREGPAHIAYINPEGTEM